MTHEVHNSPKPNYGTEISPGLTYSQVLAARRTRDIEQA